MILLKRTLTIAELWVKSMSIFDRPGKVLRSDYVPRPVLCPACRRRLGWAPKDGRSVVVDFAPAKQRKLKARYDRIEQQFTNLLVFSPIEELETILGFFIRMNAARASGA